MMMNDEQLMEIREAVAGGHNRKALSLIDAALPPQQEPQAPAEEDDAVNETGPSESDEEQAE